MLPTDGDFASVILSRKRDVNKNWLAMDLIGKEGEGIITTLQQSVNHR